MQLLQLRSRPRGEITAAGYVGVNGEQVSGAGIAIHVSVAVSTKDVSLAVVCGEERRGEEREVIPFDGREAIIASEFLSGEGSIIVSCVCAECIFSLPF